MVNSYLGAFFRSPPIVADFAVRQVAQARGFRHTYPDRAKSNFPSSSQCCAPAQALGIVFVGTVPKPSIAPWNCNRIACWKMCPSANQRCSVLETVGPRMSSFGHILHGRLQFGAGYIAWPIGLLPTRFLRLWCRCRSRPDNVLRVEFVTLASGFNPV